jgi:hypothetical protein
MGYIAFELDEQSRTKILDYFAPAHPDVIGHHITLEFGVPEPTKEKWKELHKKYATAKITGVAQNEKAKALTVSFDGNERRDDGKYFHITLSIDRSSGVKPVYSNQLLVDEPIWNVGLIVFVTGTVKFFK